MVEVRNVEVYGLDRALNAKGNSFNVGDIDTTVAFDKSDENKQWKVAKILGGNKDPHQSHDAFLKGILVSFDLKYSQAFTPELQRYHFLEIVMSQSTMHSLKKFMENGFDPYSPYVTQESKSQVRRLYEAFDRTQNELKAADVPGADVSLVQKKRRENYEAFMRLRHNIPGGFEMWETITTNYLQLKTICIQRTNHRQREDWNAFIRACFAMPHFCELTGLSEESLGLKDI
ncbi:MAG: hypothetical protein IJP62_01725 [Treponema sp.]|nr:hypothetical protein [Treponema sp.]